jgi:hypothetical protein
LALLRGLATSPLAATACALVRRAAGELSPREREQLVATQQAQLLARHYAAQPLRLPALPLRLESSGGDLVGGGRAECAADARVVGRRRAHTPAGALRHEAGVHLRLY